MSEKKLKYLSKTSQGSIIARKFQSYLLAMAGRSCVSVGCPSFTMESCSDCMHPWDMAGAARVLSLSWLDGILAVEVAEGDCVRKMVSVPPR